MIKKKLGVLITHPIQYYTPLFRYLAAQPSVDLTVYYCMKPDSHQQGGGFGVSFQWDIDLTSGYTHVWLKNKSSKPDLDSFYGCNTPEIKSIINEKKFDAFLVLGWAKKSMWQAMRACWQTRTPLLVRGDSHLHVDTGLVKRGVKDILYPYFMKKFDVCLAVGRWSAEYFEHYGAKRVIYSPHFVDNTFFEEKAAKARADRNTLRKAFNIPLDSVVFLFAGKFEEKKWPLDLLTAFKDLLEKNIKKGSVHALMVGDGALKEICETYVRENSLPVVFTGFLNQTKIPEAYAVSDVLVLPSDGRETWGLVVNETMACGLPAIVSDQVGCGPDLVREGETGFIFPCRDTRALSDAMLKFFQIPNKTRLGENAKKHVMKYSVSQAADGILKAMDRHL